MKIIKVKSASIKAYKARKLANELIAGSHEEQYGVVWRYSAELNRTHPDSTIEVIHEPFREQGKFPRFMRVYYCLGPLKKGFLAACRPLNGVDGCQLRVI